MSRLSVKICKRALALTVCAFSAFHMVVSALPLAESTASRGVIDTNDALGSPLLNTTNFDDSNWNEWETVCLGVFLSNFVQPMIDNYDSAFNQKSKKGSKGKGFNALWGGSGSDPANISVIRALTEYAIDKQNVASEEIYVGFTKLEDFDIVTSGEGAIKKPTEITDDDVRKATFRDIWFMGDGVYKITTDDYSSQKEKIKNITSETPITKAVYTGSSKNKNDKVEAMSGDSDTGIAIRTSKEEYQKEYDYIWSPRNGWIPTFYVKRDSGYIPILDYTDWWDCQLPSYMINALRNDGDTKKEFSNNFENAWKDDKEILFDSYGNITISDGMMVIPSACNRNISADHSINLLNSWIMNSYVTTVSSDEAVYGLRQNLHAYSGLGALLGKIGLTEAGMDKIMCNGLPAFGRTNIGNIGMLYYDLDSVVMKDILSGDNRAYGNEFLDLMDADISNDKFATKVPIKFEIAGSGEKENAVFNFWSGDQTLIDSIWQTTNMMGNQLPNLLYDRFDEYKIFRDRDKPTEIHVLSQILYPDGKKSKLFSEDPIMIAPKVLQTSITDENKKVTSQGAVRMFFNYVCQQYYNGESSKTALTRTTIRNTFKNSKWSELQVLCAYNLVPIFFKEYKKYSYEDTTTWWNNNIADVDDDSWVAGRWDAGGNQTVCLNTNRLVKAYPPSKEMVAAAKVLGVADGAEFGTWCTYIYMTYLDFYAVSSTSTLVNGVKCSSNFDSEIYNKSNKKNILIKDISKEIYKYEANFTDQIDIEKEVLQNSYLMLDPEKGRDYRKQIIENSMADWMYEQYNKTVYGGASEYSGSASKARSGFLSIEPYADNFLTAPFLSRYVDVAVWLIMGVTLLIIIFAIIKSKKISWVIISLVIAVNTILIVPSSGEIVPYVTSKATTKMFYSKMTFWSVSEGITNQQLASDIRNKNSMFQDMSDEEAAVVWTMVQDISAVQTDSSLCVKQDISQKVTQRVSEGTYSNIEGYQSARWILPMVMQQFSGEEATESFIYKPLHNIWEDMSNMYWYFRPADAVATDGVCQTNTSGQLTDVNSNNDVNGVVEDRDSGSKKVEEDDKDDKKDAVSEDDKQPAYKDTKYELYSKLKSIYPDYSDVKDRYIPSQSASVAEKYKAEGSAGTSLTGRINYQCLAKLACGSPEYEAHRVFYYLDESRAPLSLSSAGMSFSDYADADWWQKYIDSSNRWIIGDNWRTDSPYIDSDEDTVEKREDGTVINSRGTRNPNAPIGFEFTADQYDRNDRSTITKDMPYLLSTESPIYYIYAVIKDSFPLDASLGKVVYNLQGSTYRTANNDIIRDSQLMYATISDPESTEEFYDERESSKEDGSDLKSSTFRQYSIGITRDMLDLEEMFYNMIPYMYKMSITANGFTGDDGVLQNKNTGKSYKISKDLMYYGGERQSWMYRCNWATKLMENPTFSTPKTIKDESGKKYTVENPMMPQCYPQERPMVFSDAQKEYLGLEDSDLNIVELKCCKVNRDVARKWTLLINYAGTAGMTREIMYRQMATDATLTFCEEFSSSGILDTAYTMYPQSLDLRYMSFDSLAKMLMMNVSNSTSYIYGTTMLSVLQSSDMVTAVILLITAWVCAFLIPLVRVVLMAIIFYLGFWAALKAIFYSGKEKANIACGQFITNILFMIYTIVYYFVFYVLTRLSSGDEVITLDRISAEAGSPAWILLIVLLFSILYVVGMAFHIKFCVTNRGDMGYSQYSMLASSIADSISSSASRTKSAISNFFGGDSHTSGTSNTNSIKGTGTRDQLTDVNVKSNESNAQSTFGGSQSSRLNSSSTSSNVYNYNRSDTELESEYNAVFSYSDTEIDREEETGGTTADDINAQIDFGAEHSRDDGMN